MTPTFWGWVVAFLFTQAIEVPVYMRAQRGVGWRRAIAVGFGASAITHPIVWFVMPRVADKMFLAMATHGQMVAHDATFRLVVFGGLCEGFAVGVEAIYLRFFKVRRPLLWSLVANGASASLGYVWWSLFGFP